MSPLSRMRFLPALSLVLGLGVGAQGATLSERVVSYTISVTLEPAEHQLKAEQLLRWKNLSADTITALPFHLYLNAFRSPQTTFMRAGPGNTLSPGEEGWITLTHVSTAGGTDLTSAITFVQPDDGNEHDSTVAVIPLQTPVFPGDSIELLMHFRARLPRVMNRTGYADEFFMVAQWFPKIGVYERAGVRGRSTGGWNCHQFHRRTEFYADFGVYSVAITVPTDYVVGATGVHVGTSTTADSLTTVTYLAEDVHDFAWTASPDFVVIPARWREVDIRILMQPEHLQQADRYRDAAEASLGYLHDRLGPYPYPSLTIVDPPLRAAGAGGMEYPTLITAGTLWGMPGGLRIPEEVTVHEFTHQYWYGMVASNEVEEAWLDEGLTTYYTGRIMDRTYGAGRSWIDLPGLRSGRIESFRTEYTQMRDPRIAPVAATTWTVQDRQFGNVIYYKTATILATLERMIGTEAMDSVMRAYFLRWRFRHPSGEDFTGTFNELLPRLRPDRFRGGLEWFFDQMLYDTVTCDYAIEDLSTSPVGEDTTGQALLFHSTVIVRQGGTARIPTAIRVVFEDGKEFVEDWDGNGSSLVLRYTRSARVVSAEVDPDHIVLLDRNIVNNSRTTSPSSTPAWAVASRLALVIQTLTHLLVFLA